MVDYFREADIDTMLADFGQPVIVDGAEAIKAIIDTPDMLQLDRGDFPGMITGDYVVTFKAADVPELRIGSSVFIGSVDYSVRQRLRDGDGAIIVAHLEKVTP